jgi:hypothetical protein
MKRYLRERGVNINAGRTLDCEPLSKRNYIALETNSRPNLKGGRDDNTQPYVECCYGKMANPVKVAALVTTYTVYLHCPQSRD